jgi:hypothetical protein
MGLHREPPTRREEKDEVAIPDDVSGKAACCTMWRISALHLQAIVYTACPSPAELAACDTAASPPLAMADPFSFSLRLYW